VLRERPPVAFFLGFGESALNFELRFWSARQETWFELRSQVTLAVAKSLSENGIKIPFPQRDLHLRSVDAFVEERLRERGLDLSSSAGDLDREHAPAIPGASLGERSK
jgi:small-conductance mechanosensitive channel